MNGYSVRQAPPTMSFSSYTSTLRPCRASSVAATKPLCCGSGPQHWRESDAAHEPLIWPWDIACLIGHESLTPAPTMITSAGSLLLFKAAAKVAAVRWARALPRPAAPLVNRLLVTSSAVWIPAAFEAARAKAAID